LWQITFLHSLASSFLLLSAIRRKGKCFKFTILHKLYFYLHKLFKINILKKHLKKETGA